MAEQLSPFVIAQATETAPAPATTAAPAAPLAESAAGAPAASAAMPADSAAAAMPQVEIVAEGPQTLADTVAGFDLSQAFELIDKGGPVVVILLIMSVLALTVTLLKLFQFTWNGVGSTAASDRALRAWIEGRHQDAYATASRSSAPNAVVLSHGMRGLLTGVSEATVREDVERVAMAQLGGLRSYMRVLDSTVQIAPLLGLFGTVLGMIAAFQSLQNAGAEADPTVLAGGIWVALMTTAVGLAVAIPMAFVNTWFEGRIEREKENIEGVLTSLFTRRATEVGRAAASAHDPAGRIHAHAAE